MRPSAGPRGRRARWKANLDTVRAPPGRDPDRRRAPPVSPRSQPPARSSMPSFTWRPSGQPPSPPGVKVTGPRTETGKIADSHRGRGRSMADIRNLRRHRGGERRPRLTRRSRRWWGSPVAEATTEDENQNPARFNRLDFNVSRSPQTMVPTIARSDLSLFFYNSQGSEAGPRPCQRDQKTRLVGSGRPGVLRTCSLSSCARSAYLCRVENAHQAWNEFFGR
jgi:hypothetical protein